MTIDSISIECARNICDRISSSSTSLYNLLSLVLPLLPPGRMMQQQLGNEKTGWAQPLGCPHCKPWFESLSQLEKIKIPAKLSSRKQPQDPCMHVFSDASKSGYGVMAYGTWPTSEQAVIRQGRGGRATDGFYTKARVNGCSVGGKSDEDAKRFL